MSASMVTIASQILCHVHLVLPPEASMKLGTISAFLILEFGRVRRLLGLNSTVLAMILLRYVASSLSQSTLQELDHQHCDCDHH